MPHDPEAGKRIAKDVKRGEDGDPYGELNPYERNFHRSLRANLGISTVDPVVGRRQLVFLMDALPNLVKGMDQLDNRLSKSLLLDSTIKRWNQEFARQVLPANRYKRSNRNGS